MTDWVNQNFAGLRGGETIIGRKDDTSLFNRTTATLYNPFNSTVGRERYMYSIVERAWVLDEAGKRPFVLENVRDKFEPTITRKTVEQQTPANPGIRKVVVSTYGITVPVSMGMRVVTGNIIDAEPIVPRLEGAYEYTVEERIPVYDGGGPE